MHSVPQGNFALRQRHVCLSHVIADDPIINQGKKKIVTSSSFLWYYGVVTMFDKMC